MGAFVYLAILIPFTIVKIQTDVFTVIVATVVAPAIVIAQILVVRARPPKA